LKNWKRLQSRLGEAALRDNERLGALATVKRFAQDAIAEFRLPNRFPSTDEIAGLPDKQRETGRAKETVGYLAVLHMDGDRMGTFLSGLNKAEEHRVFSQTLLDFANEDVPKIIEEYSKDHQPAVLVYAGGDDVVALLPLTVALACADALRTAFTRRTGLTMSAGIALTPSNLPLDTALDEARAAEHTAKEGHGRDAVVVREAHRSGQIREAGGKWDVVPLVSGLQAAFTPPDAWLSAKFAYDLVGIAREMTGEMNIDAARTAEIRRLLKRRSREALGRDDLQAMLDTLQPPITAFAGSNEAGWMSMAHWAMLARFLAQNGRGGERES
jgi:CRISPR-associated protein Cmr2